METWHATRREKVLHLRPSDVVYFRLQKEVEGSWFLGNRIHVEELERSCYQPREQGQTTRSGHGSNELATSNTTTWKLYSGSGIGVFMLPIVLEKGRNGNQNASQTSNISTGAYQKHRVVPSTHHSRAKNIVQWVDRLKVIYLRRGYSVCQHTSQQRFTKWTYQCNPTQFSRLQSNQSLSAVHRNSANDCELIS